MTAHPMFRFLPVIRPSSLCSLNNSQRAAADCLRGSGTAHLIGSVPPLPAPKGRGREDYPESYLLRANRAADLWAGEST